MKIELQPIRRLLGESGSALLLIQPLSNLVQKMIVSD